MLLFNLTNAKTWDTKVACQSANVVNPSMDTKALSLNRSYFGLGEGIEHRARSNQQPQVPREERLGPSRGDSPSPSSSPSPKTPCRLSRLCPSNIQLLTYATSIPSFIILIDLYNNWHFFLRQKKRQRNEGRGCKGGGGGKQRWK